MARSAGIVVSASMGVMKPLLAKLTTLMGDEYKKLKGVRNQVSFLKDELTTMSAFLEKLAFMDDDGGELDPLVKDWRNHVREMTLTSRTASMTSCISLVVVLMHLVSSRRRLAVSRRCACAIRLPTKSTRSRLV